MTVCVLKAFEDATDINLKPFLEHIDPFEVIQGQVRGYTPNDIIPVLWSFGYTVTVIPKTNVMILDSGDAVPLSVTDLEMFAEYPYIAVYPAASGLLHAEANPETFPPGTVFLLLVRERSDDWGTGEWYGSLAEPT